MRCPKCHYITFDSGDRCRNCGYEFSLSIDTGTLDLPIQTGDEPEGPMSDFALEDLDGPDRARADPPPPSVPDPVPPRPITSSFDLPLFSDRRGDDDRPLVSAPAVPRPPLSVRKAAPVVQRPVARRGGPGEPRLDLLLPEEPDASTHARFTARESPPRGGGRPGRGVETGAAEETVAAPAGARLLAAAIDVSLLAAIDLVVLHFTLKLCGLTYADAGVIPVAPFAAFLLILNGGYATAFTAAGGQSIGKMAAGIKVVPSDAEAWSDRVPLGQAVVRAAAYLVSALPAGLGFVPALFGAEKRAVHDRLAHTRVVCLS